MSLFKIFLFKDEEEEYRLIIGLMGFALLGVMSMQLYFLRQSYQTQSDLFDRSVNDALNNVVSKLAKQDAINFLNKKAQVFDKQQDQGSCCYHRSFVVTRLKPGTTKGYIQINQ